jgi:hypothetical protein
MPTPNVEALKAEDAEVDGKGIAPWRFGFNHHVSLNVLGKRTKNGFNQWWSRLPIARSLSRSFNREPYLYRKPDSRRK